MPRITHIAYDEHENKYYIRFSGEPFYATVAKLNALGWDRARFKPEYQWPDGREKAWYIDADALEKMTDSFFNLRYQMEQAREKCSQGSLWEDDVEYARAEALRQAQERARKAEEEARKRRAEEEIRERLRQEQERIRQEYARRQQQYSSSAYTPARVQDALKVLGLSGRVTKDDLKQVHRKLMLAHHPDKHVLASEAIRKEHEQQCKKINAANDVVLEWLLIHETVYV